MMSLMKAKIEDDVSEGHNIMRSEAGEQVSVELQANSKLPLLAQQLSEPFLVQYQEAAPVAELQQNSKF